MSRIERWSPALVAAIVALLASAGVLLVLRPEGGAVALAGLVASVLLVTAAAVLGRGQQVHEAALAVAWVAVVFAAVAGLAAYPDSEWTAAPLLAAGVLATGMAALGSAALSQYRILLFPALVLGGTAVGIAAVVIATGWSPAAVAACAATLVVVAGSVVPWASVTTTRLRVPQPRNDAELLADPAPLEGAAVARQVRLGREVLIALMVSVGAVLVLTAPLVVRLGVTGTLLVVVSCIAIVLRTRQYRDGVEVGVGVVSAVAALAATVSSAALVHPGWRPVLAGALMLLGAVLLAVSATARTPNVRLGRLGDVVEAVALVALMPLLVTALGIFGG